MKRTVSLLLLVSCLSVVVISSGCSKPQPVEPAKQEQTLPVAEEPKSVEVTEQQPAAPEAPVTEPAPEAEAAK